VKFLTIGALAEAANISPPTLRRYADAGWVDCELDSSGRRIFREAAVEQARKVFARRNQPRKAASA